MGISFVPLRREVVMKGGVMSLTSAVPNLSLVDLAWLEALARTGIGAWRRGNRPLTRDEFTRIKALISAHSLPCTLCFDAHDVWFITIYVPPSAPGLLPEAVLSLAGDNVPGYVYGKRHANDYAEDALVPLARTPRNRELLQLYQMETKVR